jgi:predicted kinase
MGQVMKSFKSIFEAKEKSAVFTFGRFNPPTVGHAKLIEKLKNSTSGGFEPLVFMSHSQDSKKNPLDYKTKWNFMNKFFGKKVGIVNTKARQVFEIATALQDQGYSKVRMVVGSDRIKEFEMLLNKYNGVKGKHGYYKFDSINIISAGERDPDSDDVSGMSASKMRQAASDGDYDSFESGVPDKKHAKTLWKAVKKGMNISESTLPSYMQEDLLNEGVYDQGIFKAVFLMGGPGSGKSEVVDGLSLKSLGLKLVNTDNAFEKGLKKAGLSLDLSKNDPKDYDPIRARAKATTKIGMDLYLGNRLGLIFDTTSANDSKIKAYKKHLDALGYESKMIYVQTSLENAQKRNQMRPRKVPPEIVTGDWNKSNANAIKLQKLFGRDFIKIENDDTLASLRQKTNGLYGKLMSWTTIFPSNKPALSWKQRELHLKKTK